VPDYGPLTAEDKETVDKVLADLAAAEAQMKRAKLAGIDVSDLEAELAKTRTQAQAIKAAYFGRPAK